MYFFYMVQFDTSSTTRNKIKRYCCYLVHVYYNLNFMFCFQPKLVSEFQLLIASLHVSDIWREYTITYVLPGPILVMKRHDLERTSDWRNLNAVI